MHKGLLFLYTLAESSFYVIIDLFLFQEEPFVMETSERDRELNPDVKLKGYCVELMEELEKELEFKGEMYIVKDGKYGGQDPVTKEWNGMVGDVYNRVSQISP